MAQRKKISKYQYKTRFYYLFLRPSQFIIRHQCTTFFDRSLFDGLINFQARSITCIGISLIWHQYSQITNQYVQIKGIDFAFAKSTVYIQNHSLSPVIARSTGSAVLDDPAVGNCV